MSRTTSSFGKEYALGVQQLFAMFGATFLAPILIGLNPSVANIVCN